ncbi:hypothetical protein AAFJ72_16245 [Brevibacillus gelatini]|uniref:hypothetical protein n=1 Tax=Brevibacillus gelatini TaxID=1655277 RepID=UPI003D81393E
MNSIILRFFIVLAFILQLFNIQEIASANTVSDKTSVTLNQGESYIFYNDGTTLKQISTDASTANNRLFDYATYKEDGNGYGQGMNSAADPYIPSGGVMVVTVVSSNPVTFTYSGDVIGDVTSEPALYKQTLYKGESYTFSHNNAVSASIQNDASASKKFDYATYKEDGSLAGKGVAVSSEPSIPAGGQITVTVVTDSPVTFGGYNQLFFGYISNDPALMRITLKKGESYTFTNIGKRYRSLMNDASFKQQKLFDYAIYDQKGFGYGHRMNSQWDPNVPPGGRLVATVTTDTPVTFIYHMEFNAEPSENPALLRQVVSKDETYSFTNYGPRSFSLRNDIATSGKKYDYANYYADGTLRNKRANTSAQPFIPAGGRIVVTSISDEPITFGGYYEFLYADPSDNPALTRKTLQKGESYSLVNISSTNKQVMTDASTREKKYIDFATYNQEGNGHVQFMNSVADPYVPPGGRIVVTVVSDNPVTLIYNENDFEAATSENPALLIKTVAKGQSYTFTSRGRVKEVLKNNASSKRKFDYNIYDASGVLESTGINHMAETGVPPGGRIVVSNPYDEPITFFGYYDLFVGDGNSDGVTNETEVLKGESYVFINVGTKTKQLVNDATMDEKNKYFDYAVYKRDGSGFAQDLNASSSIQIPAGGKAVVSVTSDHSVIFRYDTEIKAEHSQKPALFKKSLDKGNSYIISNMGTISDEFLQNSGTTARKYEYVAYKADGSIVGQDTVIAEKLLVPSRGKVLVTTVSERPITFWGYYDLFVGEDGTGPKSKEIIIYNGESYVFKNRASATKELRHDGQHENSGKYFDFAAYNRDGSGYKQVLNTREVPSIPGGGRVVVTVLSPSPVTFQYDNDIDVEPSRNPALLKQYVNPAASYAFKNIGATNEMMQNSVVYPDKFDYIIYQENGTIVIQGSSSTAKPTIPPKGKMVVTNTSGSPQLFWGYYDFFMADDLTNPPSKGKQVVRQGESYVFINKATISKIVTNNGSSTSNDKLFDYAVYKQNGAGESSNINSTDTPLIPVGGRMVVTVVSESPVTFTYDEEIEVRPSATPALVKKTLRKDKSYLFTNIGNSDERLQTDAWMGRNYDYVLYKTDGTVEKRESNTVEKPLVSPGKRIAVIGTSDSIINFWGHYELFTVKENELLGKKTVYPWESYVFINNGNAPKQIPNNASLADDRFFDLAVYNKNGTGYFQKMRATEAPYVPIGGQAVVSVTSNNPVTFTYDNDFIVEESKNPALLRSTISTGNSYAYLNIGTASAAIKTDIAEGKRFEYTVYKADGSVLKKGIGTTEEPLVPAGGKLVVTNLAETDVTFGGFYKLFAGMIPEPENETTIYPAINKIFGPDFEEKVKAVQSNR